MATTQRGKTATYKCACCGDPFTARTADRARGWARFCSKSCKAKKQEARTGQHRAYLDRQHRQQAGDEHDYVGSIFEPGYFGHGQE